MKKAKENNGEAIASAKIDPSNDAEEDSDKITRIHISGPPDSPPITSRPTDQIWPAEMTQQDLSPAKDEAELGGVMGYVGRAQDFVKGSLKENNKYIKIFVLVAIVILYHVFLGFAISHNFNRAFNQVTLTVIVWMIVGYYKVVLPLLAHRWRAVQPSLIKMYTYVWSNLLVRIAFYTLLIAAIITFLVLDTARARHRLLGLGGMAFFVLFMFIFSRNPTKINWHPVIWGFFLQFCVGLMVLRWEYGSTKFNQLSEMVLTFLDFSKNGTDFVYGFLSAPPDICGMDPVFAFQSIQVVVYFGAVVALLYYYGIMQVLIRKMAWIMQVTLRTTATESLNACACIFLGMSEAPLLIRPYLEKMTASELHAVMTTGFRILSLGT